MKLLILACAVVGLSLAAARMPDQASADNMVAAHRGADMIHGLVSGRLLRITQ